MSQSSNIVSPRTKLLRKFLNITYLVNIIASFLSLKRNKSIFFRYFKTFSFISINILLDYRNLSLNLENITNEISLFLNKDLGYYNNIVIYLLTNTSNKTIVNEIGNHYIKNITNLYFGDDYFKMLFDIINQIDAKYFIFI